MRTIELDIELSVLAIRRSVAWCQLSEMKAERLQAAMAPESSKPRIRRSWPSVRAPEGQSTRPQSRRLSNCPDMIDQLGLFNHFIRT